MAHLTFHNYEGVGEKNKQDYWYSQAVCIGDRIECSGQGGWDPKYGDIHQDINAEIDQTFENIELNLKHAGGKGWETGIPSEFVSRPDGW